jgi:pilus assembly protein CpaE
VVVLNRVGRPGGLTRRQVEDALQSKVDLVIPDLPRLLGTAATLGEPAVARAGAFRTAINDLARQVAFTHLLDSATSHAAGDAAPARSRWNLLGWRR